MRTVDNIQETESLAHHMPKRGDKGRLLGLVSVLMNLPEPNIDDCMKLLGLSRRGIYYLLSDADGYGLKITNVRGGKINQKFLVVEDFGVFARDGISGYMKRNAPSWKMLLDQVAEERKNILAGIELLNCETEES
ncbi:hypothetical protein A3709_20025 [Halioglobus sp. HI00S01]|uniref:hypothetical protein n=1 Tax=Halioglobus sp. HI00S01 TaxID=1822214 RepID=UPI0007C3D6AC|nr:hypothetical protein [Halioglobus sp. HI00S01]KZX57914.1 hypothetical protein A3709_20025 [Halioglobus sp. HI00S01]